MARYKCRVAVWLNNRLPVAVLRAQRLPLVAGINAPADRSAVEPRTAGITGIRILWRPSPIVARWSVLTALAWVAASTLLAPPDLHEDDRDTLLGLTAVLPVLAGLASLYRIAPLAADGRD